MYNETRGLVTTTVRAVKPGWHINDLPNNIQEISPGWMSSIVIFVLVGPALSSFAFVAYFAAIGEVRLADFLSMWGLTAFVLYSVMFLGAFGGARNLLLVLTTLAAAVLFVGIMRLVLSRVGYLRKTRVRVLTVGVLSGVLGSVSAWLILSSIMGGSFTDQLKLSGMEVAPTGAVLGLFIIWLRISTAPNKRLQADAGEPRG